MPAATNPPTPAGISGEAASSIPRLPPSSTFDILPPLHTLLVRLLLPPANAPAGFGSPPPSQNEQPISPKDLASAASAVTAKLQKARVAVSAIEGIEVSIEEQEKIIRELEEELDRGKRVLADLGDACRRATQDSNISAPNSRMDIDMPDPGAD